MIVLVVVQDKFLVFLVVGGKMFSKDAVRSSSQELSLLGSQKVSAVILLGHVVGRHRQVVHSGHIHASRTAINNGVC